MFTNPAPFSKIIKKPTSWELISYPNEKLFSPSEGKIYDVSNECGGLIKIEHVKDNNFVYSKFCNVGKTILSKGNRVRKNEVIGNFGKNHIIFTIVNEKGNKLKMNEFFTESKKSDKIKSTSPAELDKDLLKAIVLTPFIPFKLLSKKEKVEEDIKRLQSLMKKPFH